MNHTSLFSAAVLAISLGTGITLKASIVNGSFETGDLSGWQSIGAVTVETAGSFGVVPPSGNFHALLLNHIPGDAGVSVTLLESFLGIPAGTLDSIGNGTVIQGSGLQQTFTASAGDFLSIAWNFLAHGPDVGFNDFAFISLIPVFTSQELADTLSPLSPSSSTFFRAETGFQTFTTTIATSGTYTLSLGVVDVNDDLASSGLLVDNLMLSSATGVIPEPSALATWILSFVVFSALLHQSAKRRYTVPPQSELEFSFAGVSITPSEGGFHGPSVKWTFSSINSAMTSFLVVSLAWSASIFRS